MPHKIGITLVVGVDGDRRVSEHGFGARSGKGNASAVVGEIFEMPQMRFMLRVIHFGVRERSAALGTPVYYPVALINQALVVKFFENVTHGFATLFVKRKRLARPVAAAAQTLQLFDYATAVFFLPCPSQLQKFFSADVMLVPALFFELLHYFQLGGNGRVVGAGQPKRAVALHSLVANQAILNGIVQRVPHVQLTGYVGRRYDYGKGLFVFVDFRREIPFFKPMRIYFRFKFLRLVNLFHVHTIFVSVLKRIIPYSGGVLLPIHSNFS